VSHDTRRFRFKLPTDNHILGLPIGKCSASIVRIFRTVNRKAHETPHLNVARCQIAEFIVLRIITSFDLNPFLVNVPQWHLVIIVHLKFWGYGTFYSTLFTVLRDCQLYTRLLWAVLTNSVWCRATTNDAVSVS
jgi:hypothetical protein